MTSRVREPWAGAPRVLPPEAHLSSSKSSKGAMFCPWSGTTRPGEHLRAPPLRRLCPSLRSSSVWEAGRPPGSGAAPSAPTGSEIAGARPEHPRGCSRQDDAWSHASTCAFAGKPAARGHVEDLASRNVTFVKANRSPAAGVFHGSAVGAHRGSPDLGRRRHRALRRRAAPPRRGDGARLLGGRLLGLGEECAGHRSVEPALACGRERRGQELRRRVPRRRQGRRPSRVLFCFFPLLSSFPSFLLSCSPPTPPPPPLVPFSPPSTFVGYSACFVLAESASLLCSQGCVFCLPPTPRATCRRPRLHAVSSTRLAELVSALSIEALRVLETREVRPLGGRDAQRSALHLLRSPPPQRASASRWMRAASRRPLTFALVHPRCSCLRCRYALERGIPWLVTREPRRRHARPQRFGRVLEACALSRGQHVRDLLREIRRAGIARWGACRGLRSLSHLSGEAGGRRSCRRRAAARGRANRPSRGPLCERSSAPPPRRFAPPTSTNYRDLRVVLAENGFNFPRHALRKLVIHLNQPPSLFL